MGAIYDLTELRKMSGNDEEFVQEMLVTFLSNNQEYLVLLNDACENKDWKTLKFNAHKIKPSVLLFKIDSVKQEILDLNEFSEKEINLEKIPLLVSTLKSKLYKVFDEINLELKKIKKK